MTEGMTFYIREICKLCFTFTADRVSILSVSVTHFSRVDVRGSVNLTENSYHFLSLNIFTVRSFFSPNSCFKSGEMQFSIFMLLAAGFIVVCASICCCDPIRPIYERSENMSRPTRPKIFSTPEELKSYLEELGNFYAIAGRPRFGKRTLAPWMANYMREDPALFRNLPISNTDLLQMLSSIAQNQD